MAIAKNAGVAGVMLLTDPAENLKLDGLDKNKAVVIPGLLNKVGAMSGRFAPRSVVRKIAGAIKY